MLYPIVPMIGTRWL